MKIEVKAAVITRFDLAVLAIARSAWKVMQVFDPKPLQTHFAARQAEKCVEITKCFGLKDEDATLNIARLSNMHIGSATGRGRTGLVGRKGLVKIYNAENGKFLMIRAQGCSSKPGAKHVPKDGIALNYDAMKALGIPKAQEEGLKLFVGPANIGDQEYFHMYQDPDASSRTARALSWYLAIGGVVYAGLDWAFAFVGFVLKALL